MLVGEKINIHGPINNFRCAAGVLQPQLDYNLHVNCSSGIVTVMPNAFFGYGVMLLAGSHDYTQFDEGRLAWPETGFDITIEQGVWVASGAIIIGPCIIGKYAVIGAGAVVTKNVPAYELWCGNPAHFIKQIVH